MARGAQSSYRDVIKALEKSPGCLKVSATPHFYEEEDVLREPLVAARQVNGTGTSMKIPPAVTASLQNNTWWHVWRL